MKLQFIIPVLYLSISALVQSVPPSPNPNKIKQVNGSCLSIVAKGNMFIPYTETSDGYVIVRNEKTKLYEYAIADSTGNLVVSGINAHNVNKRSVKEKRFLKHNPKHARYSGTKLKELEERAKSYKNRVQ